MSYNIDRWRTKKMENFSVPLAALVTFTPDQRARGWSADLIAPDGATYDALAAMGMRPTKVKDTKDGRVVVEIMESAIAGHLSGDWLIVEEINVRGEGSGTTWQDHLIPAFAQSTGCLSALLVWERGDTIEDVKIAGGEVRSKSFDAE